MTNFFLSTFLVSGRVIPTEGSSTTFFPKDKVPNMLGVYLDNPVNIALHEDYEYYFPFHSETHDKQENFHVYLSKS